MIFSYKLPIELRSRNLVACLGDIIGGKKEGLMNDIIYFFIKDFGFMSQFCFNT